MLLGKDLVVVGLCAECIVVARLIFCFQHTSLWDVMLAFGGGKVVERAHVITVRLIIGLTFVADILILKTGRDREFRQNLEVGMNIGPDIVTAPFGKIAVKLIEVVIALVFESQ